ncbi:TIGR00255 family protein [Singulisphaera acidiphila DSM 18658]|uniref:TIGR00255 family protein n=2 Tax=Singulisphaera acidiphila TaxID=466153 RepID=L0DB55_SINAD|nr:TIGR00255 family protein [Singulisphaera acidiphila DSM 18658]
MLLSMTGFGEARLQEERWTVSVEIRTVNNRHLKLSAKISDPYGALEPDLERLVRETIRRGTVQVVLRIDRPRRVEDYRLNVVALTSYRDQLDALQGSNSTSSTPLSSLLVLPGVVEERKPATDDPHQDWPVLSAVISQALVKLQSARAEEGNAMANELLVLGKAVATHLDQIVARGPEVVAAYQKRLIERVQSLVEGQGVTIEPKDLIREVAILSERADIAEEIVRLRAHLAQYIDVIHEPESAGRKLEFVVQEMGRETNTIGSKANDVEISRCVVEIKGLLEKIRELIQNVE